MLGYMTANEAAKLGFTHHGKYFGIPIWMTLGDVPMIATKWAPMELAMTVAHFLEGFLHSVSWPDDENVFQFMVGPRIDIVDDLQQGDKRE